MSKRTAIYLIVVLVAVSTIAMVAARRQGNPSSESASTPTSSTQAPSARDEVVGDSVFRDIGRRQNPVVVSFTTEARVRAPEMTQFLGDEDFFGRFFGVPRTPREQLRQGLGSGFIINADGEILTNNHVVAVKSAAACAVVEAARPCGARHSGRSTQKPLKDDFRDDERPPADPPPANDPCDHWVFAPPYACRRG